MAAIRYISVRSADDNPAGGTRPNFTDPFRPTSFVGAGHIVVPVENEQAMHIYEMHHVMAHLPGQVFIPGLRSFRRNPDDWPDRGIGGCQTHNGRTPGARAERSPLVYARVRAASYEGILVAANRKEKAGISQRRRR
jgi:hypothetical protein